MDPKRTSLILAAAVLFLAALAPQKAPAAEVTLFVDPADPACSETAVPACYTTIQRAIDFANNILTTQTLTTDTYKVLVEPGTYPGQIIMKPKISVQGRETARTVLSGDGGPVVTVNNMTSAVSFRNFTITNASVGISVSNNIAVVSINNNVFSVGTSGTAVQITGSPGAKVNNNTFFQNGTAVSRDADSVQIINNIFLTNQVHISQSLALTQVNIQNNFFFDPVPQTGNPVGDPFFPNINVTGTDPLFVNPGSPPPQRDLHLRSVESPCFNQGSTIVGADSSDGSAPDLGAYGGPEADTIPFPVSGVSAVAAPDGASITVNWTANTGYAVDGYRVWYGRSSGIYDGTDAGEGASPINVPLAEGTSKTLSDLSSAVVTTLSAPTLNPPQPVNEGFNLSWSAVPGATGYRIHYGLVSTDENTAEAGNKTSFILTGLKNGPENVYKIAVSAVAQTGYFIAVTAYDVAGLADNLNLLIPGEKQESVLSTEVPVGSGAITEGTRSNEVSDFPEALIPYPDLPNSSQGCFIATAAFGRYSASQVRALRAFRDRYLLTNRPGSVFVDWYYTHSPAAAAWLNEHPGYKPLVRTALMPAVGAAYMMTHTPRTFILGVFMLVVFVVSYAIYRRRFLRKKGPR